jgi:NDP-sugar pyrophosphorylase family protein
MFMVRLVSQSAQRSILRQCLADIDVFVLAGGLGTRIRPMLGDTPKLLAPIGDRTYLSFLLDWLASYGARRIIFGLGYGAAAICAEFERHPRADLDIVPVIEPEPLGTGGAIAFARPQFRTDPVMALNGDSFVDANLCEFVASYKAGAHLGAILCTQVPDGRRYGQVRIDANGDIVGFAEKADSFPGTAIINAGVYLLSVALLDIISSTHRSSIERDIFPGLGPGKLQAFTGAFNFIDIGTPESLTRAVDTLKRTPSPTGGPSLNDH